MAPKVVADFVGQLRTRGDEQFHKSRVLLSKQHLLLVEPSGRSKVPLDRVFAVTANDVDDELRQFFDASVQLGYRKDGSTHQLWIQAQPETLERFQQVLFKAMLGGATFSVYHPARVGGRVCTPSKRTVRVKFARSKTGFFADELVCSLAHGSIVQAVPGNQTANPVSGPVLSILSLQNETTYTTVVSADDKRLLNLLRCHFDANATYDAEELRRLGLSADAVQGLVWLYAGADGGSLPRALVGATAEPSQILEELSEAELVTKQDGSVELTRRGMAAASVCYDSYADELA